MGRVVGALVNAWRTPPAPAQPTPEQLQDVAHRGVSAAFNHLDQMRRGAAGGHAPPAVAGAGWSQGLDPVVPYDAQQAALWASEEAQYARLTTSYGLTPQAYASSMTDLTLERVAAIHTEVDQMGLLHNKADLDFAINRRDAHIQAAHRARIAPTYRSRLEVAPADQSPLAWAVAAFCRRLLDRIPGFQKAEEDLSSAAAHGYSGLEIVWRTPEDFAVPVSSRRTVTVRNCKGIASLESIHPRDFRWHPVKRTMAMDAGASRYIDPFVGPDGTPTRKLIFHSTSGLGDPHQRGYGFAASPLHLLKHQSAARWAVMLEYFGVATPYMTPDEDVHSDDATIAAVLSFLGSLGRGKPAFLSKRFGKVELTPTPTGIDARGQHAAILGFCNGELSKLIQGQTLSMETGGNGSYALAGVMADSKEEVQVLDAALAADTWTFQLLTHLVEKNLPQLCRAYGVTPAAIRAVMPRAYRVIDRGLDPQKQLAIYVSAKKDLGIEVDLTRIAQQLAIPTIAVEPAEDMPEQQPEQDEADEADESTEQPEEDDSGDTIAAAAQAEDGEAPPA